MSGGLDEEMNGVGAMSLESLLEKEWLSGYEMG